MMVAFFYDIKMHRIQMMEYGRGKEASNCYEWLIMLASPEMEIEKTDQS